MIIPNSVAICIYISVKDQGTGLVVFGSNRMHLDASGRLLISAALSWLVKYVGLHIAH